MPVGLMPLTTFSFFIGGVDHKWKHKSVRQYILTVKAYWNSCCMYYAGRREKRESRGLWSFGTMPGSGSGFPLQVLGSLRSLRAFHFNPAAIGQGDGIMSIVRTTHEWFVVDSCRMLPPLYRMKRSSYGLWRRYLSCPSFKAIMSVSFTKQGLPANTKSS